MTPLLGICTAAPSSGTVSVLMGSQTVTALCPRDLTVASGDTVTLIKAGSSFYVLQRYYMAAGGNPDGGDSPVPPSVLTARSGTTTFVPRATGSWSDMLGWRTDSDDIYQGEFGAFGNHTGCAFYGNSVKSLQGATVTDAWIKASRLTGGTFPAAATTLGHITEGSKPSGEPTFGGSFDGPGLAVGKMDSRITIPTALAQDLVDGTYSGLGIHTDSGAPYVRLAGLAEYGGAFALTVTWERA